LFNTRYAVLLFDWVDIATNNNRMLECDWGQIDKL